MGSDFEKSTAKVFFVFVCYFLRKLLAYVVQKPKLLSIFCLNRIFLQWADLADLGASSHTSLWC